MQEVKCYSIKNVQGRKTSNLDQAPRPTPPDSTKDSIQNTPVVLSMVVVLSKAAHPYIAIFNFLHKKSLLFCL